MLSRLFRFKKFIHDKSVLQQRSIFSGNKFERNNIIYSGKEHVPVIKEKLDENRPLSKDEWEQLRIKVQNVNKSITDVSIDAIMLGYCLPSGLLAVGKSYIKYLKQRGVEPNLATLGKFLRLYHRASKCGVEITPEDQKDIIDLHNYLLDKHFVLDSMTCEHLIHALVLTKHWRKTVDLIQMIKMMAKPSSSVYSVVVAKSLQMGDVDLAWRLLHEMLAEEKVPNCEAFISYIRYCRTNRTTFLENVEKILNLIGEYEILVSNEVVDELRRAFNEFGLSCSNTSVTAMGKCKSCNKHLSNVVLTDDEFQRLSGKFLNQVLIGKNVFLKSTPEEVHSFVKFVDRTKPYDCVIDGLNVAYGNAGHSKKPQYLLESICSVVQYFSERNKNILVVGRKHMKRWPVTQMNYIRNHSHLYLTDDLSQDDPFFLYAVLKSGSKTDFISRDLLRSHAFLFDKDLKSIFRRWQRDHQYGYDFDRSGRVHVREPMKFKSNAHQVDGCWHIPFIQGVSTIPSDLFNLPTTWLCVPSVRT